MGHDKLALRLGGETLLERTVRVVSEVTDEVLVTGLPDGHSAPPGSRRIVDAAENTGPLAGLVAGLRAMHGDRAALVACDLPYLEPRVLRLLLETVGASDAAVPIVDGRAQPACAAYGRGALPLAERRLRSAQRSLTALLDDLRVHWVHEETLRTLDPTLHSFINVNTPQDWARVQTGRAGQHS